MALEAGLGKVAADPELLQDYRHQIPSLLRAQSFPTHKAVGCIFLLHHKINYKFH